MSTSDGYALLLLDGEPPSDALVQAVLSDARYRAATDGAARTAKSLGVPLDLIIGDLDSIDDESQEHYAASKIVRIPDQYSNDFEKALRYLLDNEISRDLVILGMHGKRTDHTLTNLSVLVRLRDRFNDVLVLDEHQEHRLLTTANSRITLDFARGTRVSLTPLPHAFGVTTHGLYYPISSSEMHFGQHEGLSNIVDGSNGAAVAIDEGALLVSTPHIVTR